jgi:hypothetical protein
MEANMRENLRMIIKKVRESLFGLMVRYTKAFGKMISKMEKEKLNWLMVKKLMVNGKKEN